MQVINVILNVQHVTQAPKVLPLLLKILRFCGPGSPCNLWCYPSESFLMQNTRSCPGASVSPLAKVCVVLSPQALQTHQVSVPGSQDARLQLANSADGTQVKFVALHHCANAV